MPFSKFTSCFAFRAISLFLFFLALAANFRVVAAEKNPPPLWELSFSAKHSSPNAPIIKWGNDLDLLIVAGIVPTEYGYVENEIKFQKESDFFQKVINGKISGQPVNLINVVELKSFLRGILVAEMAISAKEGNWDLFLMRFEQVLRAVPLSQDFYWFLGPNALSDIFPQFIHYSQCPNHVIDKMLKTVEKLMQQVKSICSPVDFLSPQREQLRRTYVALWVVKINIQLARYYLINKRWPQEGDIFHILAIEPQDFFYSIENGFYSYTLRPRSLKLKATVKALEWPLPLTHKLTLEEKKDLLSKIATWSKFSISEFK